MNKFNDIFSDYAPHDDIFDNDEDVVRKLKQIISKLNDIERNLILLYVECGNYRDTGKQLGVSSTTAYYKVKEVKNKIIEKLNANGNNNQSDTNSNNYR